jgi:anthranilate phosphoribosyltransferase
MDADSPSVRYVVQQMLLNKDVMKEDLAAAFDDIFFGKATAAQSTALLILIKMKGETAQHLEILSQVARKHENPCFICEEAVDIVGTGGDGLATFNISTAAAFVAAGAGAKVIKVSV